MIKKKLKNSKGTISFNGLYPKRKRKKSEDLKNKISKKAKKEEIDFCTNYCPNARKPCNGWCKDLQEFKKSFKKGENKKCL